MRRRKGKKNLPVNMVFINGVILNSVKDMDAHFKCQHKHIQQKDLGRLFLGHS